MTAGRPRSGVGVSVFDGAFASYAGQPVARDAGAGRLAEGASGTARVLVDDEPPGAPHVIATVAFVYRVEAVSSASVHFDICNKRNVRNYICVRTSSAVAGARRYLQIRSRARTRRAAARLARAEPCRRRLRRGPPPPCEAGAERPRRHVFTRTLHGLKASRLAGSLTSVRPRRNSIPAMRRMWARMPRPSRAGDRALFIRLRLEPSRCRKLSENYSKVTSRFPWPLSYKK